MRAHPLIWFLCPAVGLAIGVAVGAQIEVSSLKTQMAVMAKIMLDQNDRCVCVEKKP